ncbi:MAG: YdcF family protein [Oscillospiraceae bacterium]|nr:YdcF family protein [Oscillospiraceae bacterium]MBR0450969.1 YdcF family protein [Oscillospiraceae bacterium]
MVRWTKRISAVLLLAILFGTMFPFTLRSFLQWIWGALPVFILCFIWLFDPDGKEKGKKILEGLCTIYLLFIVLFFGCMKWYSTREITAKPDAILVFGAEMREDGPSPMLARRCDKAFELSQEYPDAVIIVSGWKGPGDASNEAEGMRDYLLVLGVSNDRIIVEPKASDTLENILFSLPEIGDGTVAMVSDDFHLLRIGIISRVVGVRAIPVSCSVSTIRGLRFWFREELAIAWSLLHGVTSYT